MNPGLAMAVTGFPVFPLIVGLLGGLAVFLLGMELMTDALKLIAGDSMKKLLARLTTGRFRAALTGAFVTAIIQSSSVTTVLVVGFVSAGLLSLSQAIGIIMGANVGTTITAQVIAFKVTKQALFLVALGFTATFASKRPELARSGRALMGLGLIFLGMNLMAEATTPLREDAGFLAVLAAVENPFLALMAAALFTALIQTSSGTTGLVIVFASQGLIGLETGIALILGANVGTCITAWLAALGKNAETRRAALAHVLFNVLGAAIWLPAIAWLARAVVAISPSSADLEGMERIAAEVPRQIANAHGVFNVVNLLLFIGFTRPLARLLERLIKAEKAPDRIEPRFLDPLLFATPALALPRVRLELAHLARVVREFAASFPNAVRRGPRAVQDLSARDDDIDRLHSAIVGYLGRLNVEDLDPREIDLIGGYMATANFLEQIGDTLATNGVAVASTLSQHRDELADEQLPQAVHELGRCVNDSMADLLRLLDDDDTEAGREIVRRKKDVVELMRRASSDLMLRLRMGGEKAVPLYRAESDYLDLQRRVFYLVRRVAKTMLEAARIDRGEEQADRQG